MPMREREKIQEVLRGIDFGEQAYQPEKPVRIAGIQFSATSNRDQNIERALKFANVSLEKGANILCFSTLFSIPWFSIDDPDFANLAEPIPGPSTQPFFPLAEKYDAVILCPVFERDGEKKYNAVAVIGPNGLIGTYRKVHLPNIPFWEEKEIFTAGDTGFPVFETPYGNIGVQICWDNFFPEGARILALNGADIIFAPTSAAFDSAHRWQALITANAVANNLYIFRVNRVGKENDLLFYGKSFCVDPFGEFVAKPAFHKDAIVMAEIDLAIIPKARKEYGLFADRRPELYTPIVDGDV